jgi:hypothetical protein
MIDLKPADWIAITSSIGTFLSSFFILMTLFELKVQRKHSYIPDLVIPEIIFCYNSNDIKTWKTDDEEFISLEIHNIGLDVAKNINFKWSYDIHGMIEIFYKLSEPDKGELYIDSVENRLIYKKDGVLESGSSLSIDDRHADFLMASKDNSKEYNLDLPNSYIVIATAIYKHAKINEVFDVNSFDDGLLPLTLTITYKDVGGNFYRKEFKVDIKFFMKSINLKETDLLKIHSMRGRIYIKEY